MPVTVGGPGGLGLRTAAGRRAGGGGVSGGSGGFVRANPILESCVGSLARVCQVLGQAEENWWVDGDGVGGEVSCGRSGSGNQIVSFAHPSRNEGKSHENGKDEGMVDLQAGNNSDSSDSSVDGTPGRGRGRNGRVCDDNGKKLIRQHSNQKRRTQTPSQKEGSRTGIQHGNQKSHSQTSNQCEGSRSGILRDSSYAEARTIPAADFVETPGKGVCRSGIEEDVGGEDCDDDESTQLYSIDTPLSATANISTTPGRKSSGSIAVPKDESNTAKDTRPGSGGCELSGDNGTTEDIAHPVLRSPSSWTWGNGGSQLAFSDSEDERRSSKSGRHIGEDNEGPVFASQGLSPILTGSSHQNQGMGAARGPGLLECAAGAGPEIMEIAATPASGRILQTRLARTPQASTDVEGNSNEEKTCKSHSRHAKKPRLGRRDLRLECRPRVFLLTHSSGLSASNVRTVRKCLNGNKFEMLNLTGAGSDANILSSESSDLSFALNFDSAEVRQSFTAAILSSRASTTADGQGSIFAVCADSEFASPLGYIAPRSFLYLLALAAGVPMVDFSFLVNGAGRSVRHLLPLGESSNLVAAAVKQGRGGARPKTGRKTIPIMLESEINPNSGAPYIICGDSTSIHLGAPQRVISAINEETISNGLFDGWTIFLSGKFESISENAALRKRSSKDARRKERSNESNIYSTGRMFILLQLCGASVKVLQELIGKASTDQRTGDDEGLAKLRFPAKTIQNVAVIVRAGANARDYGIARKCLADHKCKLGLVQDASIPVLRAEWVLDSISDFSLRTFAGYDKAARAKRL